MKLNHVGKTLHPISNSLEHYHEHWELIYNESGRGTMIIDGKSFSFCENSITLLPPNSIHKKTPDSQFEDCFILFSDAPFEMRPYFFYDTPDKRVLSLIKILYSCFHEGTSSLAAESLLNAIISLLLPRQAVSNKNVALLKNIIIDRFADVEFSLAEATNAIPVNQDHLRRLFKRELALTPIEYLNQLRLENAKNLLSTTNLTVTEIAYLSGFYDSLYFSRIFKRTYGASPSVYRKQLFS